MASRGLDGLPDEVAEDLGVPGGDDDEGRLEARHPALESLSSHQSAALESFLAGFDDRRGLLEWLHETQYLTFGVLVDEWFHEFATSEVTLAAALETRAARERVRPATVVSDEQARETRRRIASRYLRPGYRRAFRHLRKTVSEFADERPPDPDAVGYLAMRPVLDEYRERQQEVLATFLDGFDSDDGDGRDAVLEWLQAADMATYGELGEVPGAEGIDHRLATDAATRRVLLEDDSRHERARERVASRFLLPACNRAVWELARVSTEASEEQRDDYSIPTG